MGIVLLFRRGSIGPADNLHAKDPAFGVAALVPAAGDSATGAEPHWVLPGHPIDLGGLADDRVFVEEAAGGAPEDACFPLDAPPEDNAVRRHGGSDDASDAAARDYLSLGAVDSVIVGGLSESRFPSPGRRRPATPSRAPASTAWSSPT